MDVEVSVAVSFVCSHLYNKLPRRRVDMFAEELDAELKSKFAGHWYPETPVKGSAYRCTRLTTADGRLDQVVERAASKSGLLTEELMGTLPREMTVWIDPGEVAQRIGERGRMVTLFSERQQNHRQVAKQAHDASSTLLDTKAKSSSLSTTPIDSEAVLLPSSYWPTTTAVSAVESSFDRLTGELDGCATMSSLSIGDTATVASCLIDITQASVAAAKEQKTSSPITQGGLWSPPRHSPVQQNANGAIACQMPLQFVAQQQRSNSQTMSAALFAQTKFGSTKLRSQSKRPNRLSPLEQQSHNSNQLTVTQSPVLSTNAQQQWHLTQSHLSPRSAHSSPGSRSPHEMLFPVPATELYGQNSLSSTAPQRYDYNSSPLMNSKYLPHHSPITDLPRATSPPNSGLSLSSTWNDSSFNAKAMSWPFGPIDNSSSNNRMASPTNSAGYMGDFYSGLTPTIGGRSTTSYDALALSNGLQRLVMSG